jgi:hypothetical protein
MNVVLVQILCKRVCRSIVEHDSQEVPLGLDATVLTEGPFDSLQSKLASPEARETPSGCIPWEGPLRGHGSEHPGPPCRHSGQHLGLGLPARRLFASHGAFGEGTDPSARKY